MGYRGTWLQVRRRRHGVGAWCRAFVRFVGPVEWEASCATCRTRGDLDCRTGFSREGVNRFAAKFRQSARASSRLKPVPLHDRVHSRRLPPLGKLPGGDWLNAALSGTGFSREGVNRFAAKLRQSARASSRLKPVPLHDRVHPRGLPPLGNLPGGNWLNAALSGTGFSREGVGQHNENGKRSYRLFPG